MTKRQRNYKGKQRRRRRYEKVIESTINPLPYLPENIIEEILRKLPCKAMARSRSVCKTWNSITSSTKFMYYYHKNIRQVEGNLLIFFKQYKYTYIFGSRTNFYTLSPSNGNTIVDTAPLDYYTRKQGKSTPITFLGSCNGLVAILCGKKLILWNPLTKEQSLIRVRKGWARNVRNKFRMCLFGLCYDSSKDGYVIMLVRFGYQMPSYFYQEDNSFVKVYLYNFDNFKYGQERKVYVRTDEFGLLDRNLFQGAKVICGLPHWVIQYHDSIDPIVKKDIGYFDLNEEKFKKMARPDNSDDKTMLGLATFDGENQLGCVVHDIVCANLEVWVMKEYGNSESWSNVFTFPYMNMVVDDGRSINCMKVLGFMPNGELIVYLNDKEFWVYDIDKGNRREMKSQYIDFDLAIVCEPTLIKPPEPVVKIGDERAYDYYDYDDYYYDYSDSDFDSDDYGLYVNEVRYEDYMNELYVNEFYAKWTRLRSRMGRKRCITCM